MSKLHDNISLRGDKRPSETSALVAFALLRAIDPFLIYWILSSGLLSTPLSWVGLSSVAIPPSRLWAVVATITISAARHVYWVFYLPLVRLDVADSIKVSIFNFVMSLVIAVATTLAGSDAWPSASDYLAVPLFLVGSYLETVSEYQRKQFKDDPNNKGKLFSGGLFSLAHHINYFGYTLWRTGLALTSGSRVAGAFIFVFLFFDFTTRGVPVLQDYMAKNYGAQYQQYKKSTAKFVPFIW